MIETDERPADPGDEEAGGPAKKKRSFSREFPLLIVIAMVLAILIKTFLVQAFWIPSGSMEKTLLVGDRVLVNKLSGDPARQDIIVFRNPTLPPEPNRAGVSAATHWLSQLVGFSLPKDEYLIKRVIGLPGDTVKVTAEGTYVNGTKLSEPYRNSDSGPGPVGEWHVPAGHVFVMGDNRGNSEDSRIIGPVTIDSIVGRAFVRIWPFSRAGGL